MIFQLYNGYCRKWNRYLIVLLRTHVHIKAENLKMEDAHVRRRGVDVKGLSLKISF